MPAIDERLDRDAAAWRAAVDVRSEELTFAPMAPRDRHRRRVLAVAAAVAAAAAVAGGTSVLVNRSMSSPAAPVTSTASPSPLSTRLPDRRGFTRVYVPQVPGDTGYAKNTDLAEPLPPSPRFAVLWQRNRGDTAKLIPVYDARDDVIGTFTIGDSRVVAFTCAGQDGYAFSLAPPVRHGAAASPVLAARQVYSRYGLPGYDAPARSWHVVASSRGAATVASREITLHTVEWPDGTWVVVSGQRCAA